MPEHAEQVARIGNSPTTHGIKGQFRYDRDDNRTLCGRSGITGVEHWMTGRPIQITCKACKNAN